MGPAQAVRAARAAAAAKDAALASLKRAEDAADRFRDAARRAEARRLEDEARRRPEGVAALLTVDVARLGPGPLSDLVKDLPKVLQDATREQLRREMAREQGTADEPAPAQECSVCLERVRSVAFGCGHLCACDRCAPNLRECPICRAPVTERRRIYNT